MTKDMLLIYGDDDIHIDGYKNLDFQSNVDDHKSKSNFMFILNGGVVTSKSSKQEIIANSTIEASYVAACDAAKEAIWIQKFIFEVGVVPSILSPVPLYCDNNRAIAQVKEPKSNQKSKHIEHQFHLIREIITHGDMQLQIIDSADNVTDHSLRL